MYLPRQFITLVTNMWGQKGFLWLEKLPELISLFATEWHLKEIIPFENLSYNFVARAYSMQYKKQVVIKIGFSTSDFVNEFNALTFYDGNGCVKLLNYNVVYATMLLDLIEPGTTARKLFPQDDDKAIEYACAIIKNLHANPIEHGHNFPTMREWFSLFKTLKVPHEMSEHVQRAQLFAKELENNPQNEYLLHGDLHHDNMLFNGLDSCIAIDPKGVVGEQAYEIGAFMCNPAELSEQKNLKDIFARRLDQFSQFLNINHERLIKAVYVRIVLSACWTFQDNGDWRDDIRFAELVLTI